MNRMVYQYNYRGSSTPQNTRILTCGRPSCLDSLNPQDAPFVLPPDPLPILNARPESYYVDETNWLTTDDGSVLTTDDGTQFITSNPNPSTPPPPAGENAIVEQASVPVVTEDGLEIVTESGDGNPINFEPNAS